MSYYIGIDIAKKFHVVTILDEQGEKVGKHFPIDNSLTGFEKLKRKIISLPNFKQVNKPQIVCGLEATSNLWEAIYEFLVSCKFTVFLINPQQTKQYKKLKGKKIKTDSLDSLVIAGLLRSNEARNSFVAKGDVQELRELVRLRASLTKSKKNFQKKALNLLQVLFPEYNQIMKNPFAKFSIKLVSLATLKILILKSLELALVI